MSKQLSTRCKALRVGVCQPSTGTCSCRAYPDHTFIAPTDLLPTELGRAWHKLPATSSNAFEPSFLEINCIL